jgi:hypothetical protein
MILVNILSHTMMGATVEKMENEAMKPYRFILMR